MGAIAATWYHDYQLGYRHRAAMIINLFAAALAGILLPLLAQGRRRSGHCLVGVRDHGHGLYRLFRFLGIATWWFGIFNSRGECAN
jgi:magnesium transporter